MNEEIDHGVSDLIAVILLISITTISIGVIGVSLISQISVTDIPQAELTIVWQHDPTDGSSILKPYIVFERGESLDINSTKILVDGKDVTKENDFKILKKPSTDYSSWNSTRENGKVVQFSIGDVLKWDSIENQAKSIAIIYSAQGKELLIQSGSNPFE